MRALAFREFGVPDVLGLVDIPTPRTEANQVLVRVHVAGLNFADVYRREGHYHLAGTPPWILGYEGAGVIEAIGDAVTGVRIGDRVGFADSPHANAEYVAVDADRLIPLPDFISFETAAALLLQGLTAQYLVTDSHDVQPGETILVHAAAGGVGLLLCQLAAQRGANVIGLASTSEKRAATTASGAKWVFGYDNWAENVRAIARPVDVVYDSVGSTLDESLAIARTGGHVVFYGMAGGDPAPVDPRILMDRSLSLTGGDLWNILESADVRRQRAGALFEAVHTGTLSIRIAARFPLADGAAAHTLLQSRAAIGKVLLMID